MTDAIAPARAARAHCDSHIGRQSAAVRRARVLAVIAVAVVGAVPAASLGATKTWTNGAGTSAWSTGTNWSGTPAAEPGSGDDVVFPSSVPLSSFFISLSSGEQARSLVLNNFYHLQGGSLTLATSTVSIASGFNGFITSVVQGSAGLSVSGGRLDLQTANTFTGGVTVSSGGILSVTTDAQLGNAANSVTLLNSGELIAGANITTSRVFSIGSSGGKIQQVGGSTLTLNSGFASTSNQLTVNGFGTLALNASSFRSGGTFIQNGTVRLNHGTGLGTGIVTISNGGRLEISAGITTNNRIVLEAGTTLRTGGAGAVAGVAAGSHVNVASTAPVFIDSGPSTSATLQFGEAGVNSYTNVAGAKTVIIGQGTVTVPGDNVYDGDWQVDSGTLRITSATALGTGASPVVVNNGGALAIGANIALDRAI